MLSLAATTNNILVAGGYPKSLLLVIQSRLNRPTTWHCRSIQYWHCSCPLWRSRVVRSSDPERSAVGTRLSPKVIVHKKISLVISKLKIVSLKSLLFLSNYKFQTMAAVNLLITSRLFSTGWNLSQADEELSLLSLMLHLWATFIQSMSRCSQW